MSNLSSMDDPSAYVIEYRSYWLSIYFVLTLKEILGYIIFVPGGNNEHLNGALNLVDFAIFS